MATKSIYHFASDLIVTLKSKDIGTLSFTVDGKKLIHWICALLLAFFILMMGTVLFFKEIERSRKLEDRVVRAEIQNLLTNMPATLPKVETPITIKTPPITPALPVAPRVQAFEADCESEICSIQVSLVPTHTGLAQGELLVLLETEIPRIGSGPAMAETRKRFYVYPGNEFKDDLTENDISQLTRKPYRFAKALQTSTEFTVGHMKPISIHLYLYDTQKNLLHHEKKNISIGEPNAP